VALSLARAARRLRGLIVALDRRGPRAEHVAAAAHDAGVLTAFPAMPGDVAALTVQEFAFDLDELDGNRGPSMDRVCRAFMDDANRALVWWIRFGALKNWSARTDVMARSTSDSRMLRDACEVAASFPLNHLWEFDPIDFGFAVETVAVRRARADDRSPQAR
jgi:hypothetical protein